MNKTNPPDLQAVWLTAIASVLLFAGLSAYLAPLNPNILALQFAATPRAFGAIIHIWPLEHLARFRNHLPVDCLLLLCYGSFGYLFATRTAVFSAFRALARLATTWTMPVAALFDATENALHWWLTEVPRFGVPLPFALAATAAVVKWLLIIGFALAVAYAMSQRARAGAAQA